MLLLGWRTRFHCCSPRLVSVSILSCLVPLLCAAHFSVREPRAHRRGAAVARRRGLPAARLRHCRQVGWAATRPGGHTCGSVVRPACDSAVLLPPFPLACMCACTQLMRPRLNALLSNVPRVPVLCSSLWSQAAGGGARRGWQCGGRSSGGAEPAAGPAAAGDHPSQGEAGLLMGFVGMGASRQQSQLWRGIGRGQGEPCSSCTASAAYRPGCAAELLTACAPPHYVALPCRTGVRPTALYAPYAAHGCTRRPQRRAARRSRSPRRRQLPCRRRRLWLA